jgi:hypothetical protein
MKFTFDLELNPVLARELTAACRECEMPIRRFASEAVEVVLAGRRLATSVPAGRCGARVKGDE